MFDTEDALLQQIQLGEDGRLEFKAVQFRGERVTGPHADGLADELAAFANSSGGVVILGFDEGSKQPQGLSVEELDRLEQWLQGVIADRIKPPMLCRIEKWRLPNAQGQPQPILKVDIPRSLFVHESPNGHFYRIGSSKRRMSTEYIIRLGQQRSQTRLIRFDDQPVVQAPLSALDASLYERFRTSRSRDEATDFLSKLGLAARDDQGELHPSVSGVLMATAEPRDWMPNAFIQAVAYHGTSPAETDGNLPYQLDARDLSGPLDEQVREACRFVARNMKVAAVKTMGRRDIPQYDLTAVFEAMVNAVAHRDYAIYGAKIRLRLYSDRLELYSPGSIPNAMTIESLLYRQSARNETLTSLLAKCPVPTELSWLQSDRQTYMDKRGEGVRIIFENSERLSGRRPEYRLIDDDELLLTIFAATGVVSSHESL
ncbi:MAG: ATP-binding protein [Lamprobacter sp.]|uniref:ATP-binding protein n=1 Tax=Lamprobacter sp. TaxID=3100796 RepID=UPI002B2619DD|nr:ATP-binding protein [Lamprobacter sp.]MEA3638916.1 ATP-binding protein [Lamprobacter sp.]